jgi:hypothetical protein
MDSRIKVGAALAAVAALLLAFWLGATGHSWLWVLLASIVISVPATVPALEGAIVVQSGKFLRFAWVIVFALILLAATVIWLFAILGLH